jgi:hypothetical protein
MKIFGSVLWAKVAIGIIATLLLNPGCSSAGDSSQARTRLSSASVSMVIAAGDFFIAPNGTAANPGTSDQPTTLENATTRIAAGNTIWVRGGTYKYSAGLIIAVGNNGTSSAHKNLYAFKNEAPVFDFSGEAVGNSNRGLTLNGNFWHLKGLVIEHAGDNGIYLGGSDNTIELCTTRFNADSGLQISRAASSLTDPAQWPSNNLILNCTSHDNKDPGNENADGFACKLTAGSGNAFRGCIAHHNIDDGWDLYAKTGTGPIGPVLIEDCIAYSNGTLTDSTTSGGGDKNGFKLGGSGIAVPHTIRRCIAFNNGKHGFTDNNNPGPINVTNNTAFNNAQSNFNFRTGGLHVFMNNASLSAGMSDKAAGVLSGTTNLFWDKKKGSTNSGGPLVISEADFVSLKPPSIFTRNEDGSIHLGDFARLAPGSDLINAGTPLGTDIGAVENR